MEFEDRKDQVENDWRLQSRCTSFKDITPEADAKKGVDGIKDGSSGFRTCREPRPWWQVDLGKKEAIARVVIWNQEDSDSNANDGYRNLRIHVSDDGKKWKEAWRNRGTPFSGTKKGDPRVIHLKGQPSTRFVRLLLPKRSSPHLDQAHFLHLDEVEIFPVSALDKNIALNKPATQSSISILSSPPRDIDKELDVRWQKRKALLQDPLLDFDSILFAKRVPPSFNHMSDQYLGWWSNPGGGIYLLKNFKTDHPTLVCLSKSFKEPGSFLRPTLSYDAKKVLFAWARYYPGLKDNNNKLDKGGLPEDSFFHLFEMNIDGSGLRQLTHGKYNDFDGRYLPSGRIVFLSTRRGPWVQAGKETARRSVKIPDLPEGYVRCGGNPRRPCAIYTLHTINADGGDMVTLSPFEMFEWTPSVNHDGTILYARWDYVDRHNQPFMGLWSVNPDGTNARLVYGNYTRNPCCTFEARAIPNSNKLVFTASAHHAHTFGSLVLLDPTQGMELNRPIKRLTPEVPFPESERWTSPAFYANPWPLSEKLYLVSWGVEAGVMQAYRRRGMMGYLTPRQPNGMGIYLFRDDGTLELLYRDPEISSCWPIPVRPRKRPPVIAEHTDWEGPQEGNFLLNNVYHGLKKTKPGEIKELRIVAIPPKVQPCRNKPSIGLTYDDPGKCLLGTVPVEEDGSAYFRVPSGVSLFFQALDKDGVAIQTMRSASYVMPGTTLSCNGCHEPRNSAGIKSSVPIAARRAPSKLTPGPSGSWPLRYDTLVKPVLDRNCVRCHNPKGKNPKAAQFNLALSPRESYDRLTRWGDRKSLRTYTRTRYNMGISVEKGGGARTSSLMKKITDPSKHPRIRMTEEDRMRLVIWMDLYAQFQGSFSPEQEEELRMLKGKWSVLLNL